MTTELSKVITNILCDGNHFISGVQSSSDNPSALVSALVQWGSILQRDLGEIIAVIEPCVRQSILMSLIPAQGVDPAYNGNIDKAINEHLMHLGLDLGAEERRVIRDICINVRKLHGLNSRAARNITMTIAELRGDSVFYKQILNRQQGRCIWCGVELASPNVKETLEHVAPKHLGDDPADGKNWAISCSSCNNGKSNILAWAACAEAHDYLSRKDFSTVNQITLLHRWAVLMRTRKCVKCEARPTQTELWVYRRVSTGLPIPANCSLSCINCASRLNLEILLPKWMDEETNRSKPSI